MKTEELEVFKVIEDEILTYVQVCTKKMVAVYLDEIYGKVVLLKLQEELRTYIHKKLIELANISIPNSDEPLINELCRYILQKSSLTSIDSQGTDL